MNKLILYIIMLLTIHEATFAQNQGILKLIRSKETLNRKEGFKKLLEMTNKKEQISLLKTLELDSNLSMLNYSIIDNEVFDDEYHFDMSINQNIYLGDMDLESRVIAKLQGMGASNLKAEYLNNLIPTTEIAKVVFRMFLIDEEILYQYLDIYSMRYIYIQYLTRYFEKNILQTKHLDILKEDWGSLNGIEGSKKSRFRFFLNPDYKKFVMNELKQDTIIFNKLDNWMEAPKYHNIILLNYFKRIKEFCSKELGIEYNKKYKEQVLLTHASGVYEIFLAPNNQDSISKNYSNRELEEEQKAIEEKLQKEKQFIEDRLKKNKEDAKKYLEQEAEKERIFNQKPEAERKKIKDDIKKAQDEHLKAQELERQKYIKEHPEMFKDK